MLKLNIKSIISVLFVLTILLVFGCENDAQNTALIGSGIGAGIGALADGDTDAILTGAAVGGAVGYGVGNESDKKKMRQEMNQIRVEQNVETIWITNSNGSQIPVRLVKDGPGYIGPRGERYAARPTEEQLKQVYGF